MPSDHLSTLCVSLLTQLLDLSTLEELQDVEREGFVSENVDIEDNAKESKPDMKEENDGEEKKDEKSQVKRLFMKVANSKKGKRKFRPDLGPRSRLRSKASAMRSAKHIQ